METIQIVLDKKLLLATNRAARRAKRNRSALVRDKERQDRQGYLARPEARNGSNDWEAEAAWPEE